MEEYYVYKHLKKGTDEVFYIGKGKGKRAYWPYQRNDHWHNTVAKYGYDVIIIEDGLSEADAFALEIDLITQYGRKDIRTGCLVNWSNGGEGLSGRIAWNKGKKMRPETYAKLRKIWDKRSYLSEETKHKMREAKKGKIAYNSLVILNELTGIFYTSVREAAESINWKNRRFGAQLRGKNTNKTNMKII